MTQAGLVVILVIWIQIACQIARNPVAARQAEFEERLRQASRAEPEPIVRRPLSYAVFQEQISQRLFLWQPLVGPPETPPQEPNWASILGDLKVSQVVGEGAEIRAKISLGRKDSRGQWVTPGSVVNGAVVREISDKGVVFVIEQEGREYVRTVPR